MQYQEMNRKGESGFKISEWGKPYWDIRAEKAVLGY